MRLSRSAQAARANGYGSLKAFREVSSLNSYKIAAGAYERKHGLARGSALKATSVFARFYGKAFFKDGNLRSVKDIPPSYLKRVQDQSLGSSLQSTASFEDY
jgi:hypothetical protein